MLGLLGDEWTLLVMQQSLLGATRFGDFKARLPVSNSVMTARLRALTDEGLLDRREYHTRPSRFEYPPTTRGRSLWPVLVSIWEWERRWVPDHATPLPRMQHLECGDECSPVVTCRACGSDVGAEDVVAHWGPSGSWSRSVPPSSTRRRSESAAAGLFPQTMSVMGNRWGFALLVAGLVGIRRFSDFQSQLGAPPGSVADRLSILTANEVFDAADNRYRPTEKGYALFAVVITALQWAQRWYEAPDGPAVVVEHPSCGHRFTAVLTCDRCRRALRGTTISVVSTPESD
ncbi:helix-turn-helix transcriptional regulator [Mycolicibacterium flavescens]|uniref:HxlR family transcriptional regulator n=1 Tax=Mycolicibacterium flavescens TaxID=1776 RepID=A0A1E3RFF2_MYCFV|nr:winged helix-turn-helix transcriptional regulator [Mycolicibacterium flavescens]MCV7280721.1 helix-turn-helix transcriptional regulator [Mycolicibacterium flavescens]ODQ88127.1 HxlR family transcriptional regulator [Mycolicibacterium flavescens]